jgi:hypothetical protein
LVINAPGFTVYVHDVDLVIRGVLLGSREKKAGGRRKWDAYKSDRRVSAVTTSRLLGSDTAATMKLLVSIAAYFPRIIISPTL